MVDPTTQSGVSVNWRAAAWLVVLAGLIVLALLPIAMNKSGSAGPWGLLIAAAICLSTSLVAELLGAVLLRRTQPLVIMLVGMAIRLGPAVGVCVYLAARGQQGRQHLAFISYFLAFYLITLAAETYFSVKRIGGVAKLDHTAP